METSTNYSEQIIHGLKANRGGFNVALYGRAEERRERSPSEPAHKPLTALLPYYLLASTHTKYLEEGVRRDSQRGDT